jgi:CelD/BcsL family acetyltransferase involved in cellulose biosynthesis
LGHDPAFSKYSPGNYLLTHVIEDCCRHGVRAIDFGLGEALYKKRFGNEHWTETTVHLYARTWAGMEIKAIHTAAVVTSTVGKKLLERTHLIDRVKRIWRRQMNREESDSRV